MNLEETTCYRALAARDPRFDGLFFVGITTTRIYCRPVCPARTAKRAHCRFFPHPALAESAGFRPCLRCRPELAPGQAPIDQPRALSRRAIARIQAGALNEPRGVERLADDLGYSSRHLRRVVQLEFGVAPIAVAQTQRLLLAKQLLTETDLSIARIAFASGFGSLRRFNALFQSNYRLAPGALRRAATRDIQHDELRLTLAYRPPFDWGPLIAFLGARAIPGVERIDRLRYQRTLQVGDQTGWLSIEPVPGRNSVQVHLASCLVTSIQPILAAVRHLLDLDARPDQIASHLESDRTLAPSLARHPGLRVPGAVDGFETAVRAVLGQLISVRAANTLAHRVSDALGSPVESPFPGLTRIFPKAETLAAASRRTLAGLGLRGTQADALRALAVAELERPGLLSPGADPESTIEQLIKIKGIGLWTAHYLALRTLRWPDAFPHGDLGLNKASGCASPRDLLVRAEAWKPWRSYAAMHLWQSLTDSPSRSM